MPCVPTRWPAASLPSFVTDYLEGELPRRQRRRVERHLGACEGLHSVPEQMRLDDPGGDEPPPAPVDPEVREHLLQMFREPGRKAPSCAW